MTRPTAVKGLKARLPCKPCMACGRPMAWRRAWAKNWAQVRYCSEACRRRRKGAGDDPATDPGPR
ncbi:MAG: DUF2256 domain-containing protein [Burkholderiaceae bacterium]